PYVDHPLDGSGYGRAGTPNPGADLAPALSKAYDGDVGYLDAQIGRLVDELRHHGLYDDALIVVTSDHGEELHAHGGGWRGATLSAEQLRVPLIVKPPGGRPGGARTVDALVTSLDVAPTIIRAAGLVPPDVMQGRALAVDGTPPSPERESVYAQQTTSEGELRAVRTRAWKLVATRPASPAGPASEALYDLIRDPAESTDVAVAHPVEREELRAALGRGTLEARAQAGKCAQADVDAATRARLEALGYVGK